MFNRTCSVYRWNGSMMVQDYDVAHTGLKFGGDHIVVWTDDNDPITVGQNVVAALNAVRFGLPLPVGRPGVAPAHVRSAGFKSNKAFSQALLAMCNVLTDGATTLVAPLRRRNNLGADYLWNDRITVDNDPRSIGEGVLRIMEQFKYQ